MNTKIVRPKRLRKTPITNMNDTKTIEVGKCYHCKKPVVDRKKAAVVTNTEQQFLELWHTECYFDNMKKL